MRRQSDYRWGQVKVGDEVTSFGRHGAGQPRVTGELVRIEGQTGIVRTAQGERRRTVSNLRPVIR